MHQARIRLPNEADELQAVLKPKGPFQVLKVILSGHVRQIRCPQTRARRLFL